MATYTVSTIDLGDGPGDPPEVRTAYQSIGKWRLREAIRDLRSRGYSEVSIAIDRDDFWERIEDLCGAVSAHEKTPSRPGREG